MSKEESSLARGLRYTQEKEEERREVSQISALCRRLHHHGARGRVPAEFDTRGVEKFPPGIVLAISEFLSCDFQ